MFGGDQYGHMKRDATPEFSRIVAANLKRFQYLARAYSDGADAQDLLQEILLQVWRSLANFRGEAGIGTWVYRVALNTAISYLRSSTRQPVVDLGLDPNAFAGADAGDAGGQGQILEEFLHSLNRVDRAVLLLYLEDKTYVEMAEILGMNANQLGVRINRIKAAFKAAYTEV